MCKFFITYKRCKFGDFCRFKHIHDEKSSENTYNFQLKIENLEEALKKHNDEIEKLNIKIESLEEIIRNKIFDEKVLEETEQVEEFIGNDEDEKWCPICGSYFMNKDALESHMNSHSEIIQLDGNINDEYQKHRNLNEYETRDPITEAPYFFNDDELEDFIVKCKVCGKEFDGKAIYNTHIDIYQPCKICQQYNGGKIHHCPYRDFFLPV